MSKITLSSIPPYNVITPIFKDLYQKIQSPEKKIFMFECNGSLLLAKAALLGYNISGISEDPAFLDELKLFCNEHNLKYSNLIHGRLEDFDCSVLENQYDLLFSSGLLIRLPNPGKTIAKWQKIVKPNGIVFNCGPNCYSVNGKTLKRLDLQAWRKLTPLTIEDFDKLHTEAGLVAMKKAYYGRGFDIHMLTPWDKIQKMCKIKPLYIIIKYGASFVELILKRINLSENKHLNSFIFGFYNKKTSTNF
jgi:2-polyprenyl-3-methyl-5-hydroxy-6-metoxy-1,4-benzoquinol methylase